ncbi:MAG TPA: DUF1553 domain-containing protein [Verrucomicrobiae bacterium]
MSWPYACRRLLGLGVLLVSLVQLDAAVAVFTRGINLNGPATVIDGQKWEAGAEAKDFKATGKTFENQKVVLKPPTDAARTQMIRSSVWGNKVDLEFSNLAAGTYQVFLYVWEDNHSEQFDLLVNDKVVQSAFHSGTAGMWKRLGPWRAEAVNGKLTVVAKGPSHGAANLSGVELWAGEGTVPELARPQFINEPNADQLAFFESRIRPALVEHCYECHSAGAEKIKGGLVLDSRAGVQKGGDTGAAITPGDPEASLLIHAVRHASEDVKMPPKKKLPPKVIADLEEWVRMGAPDPRSTSTLGAVKAKETIDWAKAREWWSLRPLESPALPKVKNTSWPVNEIDRFVLAKVEAAKLTPAPDAEPRALIRRMTYDLHGLPPTPEEVEAFVQESRRNAKGAVSKLVDRLLASPRYGERWGRHWLDVVRYADTAGDNSDYPIPQMHRYRDWVIDAFNRDLPYDEFVRDQLAGDLRGGNTDEERFQRIIATGYIANSRRFGSRVDDYPQHLTIEDTLDSLGRSFLGLTINCARCHDHKFDPISTQDYYALYGVFNSTRYPWPGIELDKKQRDLVMLVSPEKRAEAEAAFKARAQEQARLDKEVKRLKDELKDASEDKKATLKEQLAQAEKAAGDYLKQALPVDLVYAVAEATKIADVRVQQKGDPAKPGEMVPRRFLQALGGQELPAGSKASGREQLAGWIVAKDNPLTARVMVNRIWQNHFGRGIVPTPNDFGKNGKPASHPELLDFLAAKFRDDGWSIKAMHRMILSSRTYQQAAVQSPAALERDPANELLASFPRRRLDAESIRDALLYLGGNLDLFAAGAHPFPPQHQWDFTQHKPFKADYASNHRSVFLMTQRIQRHPYLSIFDGADPSTSTPVRTSSTTPLQALYLLNDAFVHEQSQRVAGRVMAQTADAKKRINHAYELLFARPPQNEEIAGGMAFIERAQAKLREDGMTDGVEKEAWCAYVRVLFRLNEFVYLD